MAYRYKESGAPSPKVFTYECPDCLHRWEVLTDPGEPPPEACPKCQETEVAGPVPSTRSIGGSALGRSVDKMYREMETTSAWRAEQAGAPELKITNLKDQHFGGGMKQGDVSAKPVVNTITQFQDQMGMNNWGAGAPGGVSVTDLVAASRARGTAPGSKGLQAIQSGKVGGAGGSKIPPRR